MNKCIGIVGSRRRNTHEDFEIVQKVFLSIYDFSPNAGDTIVSGGCPEGADNFAEELAAKFNAPIKIYPADWKKFGRSAGFQRNGLIAQDATILIACVAPDRKGGTEDTIKKYLKLGKTQLILC